MNRRRGRARSRGTRWTGRRRQFVVGPTRFSMPCRVVAPSFSFLLLLLFLFPLVHGMGLCRVPCGSVACRYAPWWVSDVCVRGIPCFSSSLHRVSHLKGKGKLLVRKWFGIGGVWTGESGRDGGCGGPVLLLVRRSFPHGIRKGRGDRSGTTCRSIVLCPVWEDGKGKTKRHHAQEVARGRKNSHPMMGQEKSVWIGFP